MLTQGSAQFRSQAMTFTKEMEGYTVLIGNENYEITNFVDAHTVTLDRNATTSGNALAFTVKEGFVVGIDKPSLKGTLDMDVRDFEVAVNLGFIGAKAGGEGTRSGIHVGAEAEITFDRDTATKEPDRKSVV